MAVPVAPPEVLAELRAGSDPIADEVVCVEAPEGFMAVGMHNVDFRQTQDGEVVRLLASSG